MKTSHPIVGDPPLMRILSPGALLSRKREEFGWTRAEVARELNLSERQIEAIEKDDYPILPGKTYIMGYWRSYAKLLQISIDESIQVHRANLSTDRDPLKPSTGHSEVQGREERSRKRWVWVFGMLLAVFLIGIWYWQSPNVDLPPRVAGFIDSLRSGESGRNEGVELPMNDGDHLPEGPTPETGSELVLPEPNFSEDQAVVEIDTKGYEVLVFESPIPETVRFLPTAVPEPNLTPTQEVKRDVGDEREPPTTKRVADLSTEQADERPGPVDMEPSEPAPVPSADSSVDASSVEDRTVARIASVPEPALASGFETNPVDHRIAFEVAQETWIDVRDSTGIRLIYRTVNRGEDIQLTGVPPYSVFIGSADGVTVRYRGAKVPFLAHESGLFARFEVGE